MDQAALTADATLTADAHVGDVPTQFIDGLLAALDSLLTDYDPLRLSSDFSVANLQVPAGSVRYQVQAFMLPQSTMADGNIAFFPSMLVRVLVHYHLAVGEAELAWTQYGMQTAMLSLIDPSWWRDLPLAFYLDEEPVGSAVQRVGNVVSFTVSSTVTIRPAGE